MDLTKDAQKLISTLYKSYLEKLKLGLPKSQAKKFGSYQNIHDDFCNNWLPEDVNDTCNELSKAKMLKVFYSDDVAYVVSLSDEAIAYMDNKFKNNIKEVTTYISNLL